MVNANLLFVPRLDRFVFSSGKFPIVISAPHAHSIARDPKELNRLTLEIEIREHLCDYAVQPLLQTWVNRSAFNIVENQVSRLHVDMNRAEARQHDQNDLNDYLFRQFLRFIAEIVGKQSKLTPLFIDLHSYPPNDPEWKKYDMVVLIQTKNGMTTDPSLVQRLIELLPAYKIGTTKKHAQDDIVEEIAYRRLGLPLLIEINEKWIKRKEDLHEMGLKLGDALIEIIQDRKFHVKFQPINRPLPTVGEKERYLANAVSAYKKEILSQISDGLMTNLFNRYVDALGKYLELPSTSVFPMADSVAFQMTDYLQKLERGEIIEERLFIDEIHDYAHTYDTCIIPIEIIEKRCQLLLTWLNRVKFEEWFLPKDRIATIVNELIGYDKKCLIQLKSTAKTIFGHYLISALYDANQYWGIIYEPVIENLSEEGCIQDKLFLEANCMNSSLLLQHFE